MLKKSLFSPTLPGAPRRAFHQAAFSPRKPPQCSPLGEQAVLAAWGGRVRNATPPVLSSAAALLDRLFEHPAGNPLVPELQASTLCYAEMVSPQKGETGWLPKSWKECLQLHRQANITADLEPARHRCGCPAQLTIQNLDAVLSCHREYDMRVHMHPFSNLAGPLPDRENVLPALRTTQIELIDRIKILRGI